MKLETNDQYLSKSLTVTPIREDRIYLRPSKMSMKNVIITICFVIIMYAFRQNMIIDINVQRATPQATTTSANDNEHGSRDTNSTNINVNTTLSSATSVSKRMEGNPPPPEKGNLALLLCNEMYCLAAANLIASIRADGGYMDDIAVVIGESANYTKDSLKRDIIQEGGGQDEAMANVDIWSAEELFDMLHLNITSKYLRETPPMASCQANNTASKHRAYYLKSLIFHPVFTNWSRLIYMDGCMTIHSPHINEIFSLPEAERHILVSPDPWYWGRKGIGAKFVSCPDQNATNLVKNLVGIDDMTKVRYFASGVIMYDTSIVREYGASPAATLMEILSLYQKLGKLFYGDQEILSIYWMYMRDQFQVFPLAMLGSNRVPYEFVKRIPGDPHIITAGHKTRKICTKRATNSKTTR